MKIFFRHLLINKNENIFSLFFVPLVVTNSEFPTVLPYYSWHEDAFYLYYENPHETLQKFNLTFSTSLGCIFTNARIPR